MEYDNKTKSTKRLRIGKVGKPSEGTPMGSSGGFSHFLYLGNAADIKEEKPQTGANAAPANASGGEGTKFTPANSAEKRNYTDFRKFVKRLTKNFPHPLLGDL